MATAAQRKASNDWKKRNPQKHSAINTAWAKAHPEKVSGKTQEWRLRNPKAAFEAALRRKGLDPTSVVARPARCQVCDGERALCVDHCHATKRFRGWLCNNCNTALGLAGDSPSTLRKLADYLERR